ncbi:MAG: DUF3854 domain-containing protein [Dehalobacter sp.]|nr:DUF3854 domain-containing protein [Dehalobacter sp.]
MSGEKKLNERHLEQLQQSGITDMALIKRAGLWSADQNELQGLFQRRDIKSGGLVFPYPHIDGFRRVRLDEPLYIEGVEDGYRNKSKGPKEIRYLSRKGQENHLYLPLPGEELKKDTQLYVTEGEKKTLSLVQAGLPAVGVAGVWSWRTSEGVCQEFNLLNWRRSVSIIFDSDAAENRLIRAAMIALARELSNRGADVNLCILPRKENTDV